jgi:hypothetical protein
LHCFNDDIICAACVDRVGERFAGGLAAPIRAMFEAIVHLILDERGRRGGVRFKF